MAIPIQNIYYMFCYAWGHFAEGEKVEVGGDDSPELPELLTRVLIRGTRTLLRRGLDRSYIEAQEDTQFPRGRIDFGETVKRTLLRRGLVNVLVDDLSPNIHHNQIIKTTIGRLIRQKALPEGLRSELTLLYRQLQGVDEIRLVRSSFWRVALHRNNSHYRFLLHICELLYALALPEEDGKGFSFYDVLNDEGRMARVFEEFLRNFFAREQSKYRLGSRRIVWDVDYASPEALTILPAMENDVRLDSVDETIIIDAKYYKEALLEHHGKQIARPGHLYQLFAYLKNTSPTLPASTKLSGILIYPTAKHSVDAIAQVQGIGMRIVTLNLNQHWREIRKDLLGYLQIETT